MRKYYRNKAIKKRIREYESRLAWLEHYVIRHDTAETAEMILLLNCIRRFKKLMK